MTQGQVEEWIGVTQGQVEEWIGVTQGQVEFMSLKFLTITDWLYSF